MKPRVYIETSVIGYLTAWPSSDVIVAGHQEVTRHWWKASPDTLTLVVSELVIQEVSAGDEIAAQQRLDAIEALGILEITEEAVVLAEQIVQSATLPKKAAEDALGAGTHFFRRRLLRLVLLLYWGEMGCLDEIACGS